MLSKLRPRSAYDVMAGLALFLTLTGGTAVALSGTNTVFTDDIVNGQVKDDDLGDGNVTERKLANGAVTTAKFRDNNLRGVDVFDNSLTSADIGTGGVRTDELGNGQVQAEDLAPGVAPGASGVTNVVVRTEDFSLGTGAGGVHRSPDCASGERATGGGVVVFETATGIYFLGTTTVGQTGPTGSNGAILPAGTPTPRGWGVDLDYDAAPSARTARFYVVCAKP